MRLITLWCLLAAGGLIGSQPRAEAPRLHVAPLWLLPLLPRRSSSAAGVLLLLLSGLSRGTAQPTQLFAIMPPMSRDADAYATTDGGRAFSTIPLASAEHTWSVGMSSPTGDTSVLLNGEAVAANKAWLWVPSSRAFSSFASGMAGMRPYVGAIGISRASWVSAIDAEDRIVMHQWTNGTLPYFSVYEGALAPASCTTQVRSLAALPSKCALSGTSPAGAYLNLWCSAGCLGELDLVGAGTNAVWEITSAFTSVAVYGVLVASGPAGCGAGFAATCAGAAAGRIWRASITGASSATALLNAGNWVSAAAPSGGGVNLLKCYDKNFCYAAASWQPDAYTGGCDYTTTGFAVYASVTGGAAWAHAGCAPLTPHNLAVADFTTLYLAGAALGGSAMTLVYSADKGATWRTLAALPAGLSGGSPANWGQNLAEPVQAPLLSLTMLGSKGGPVFLSGMDAAFHCGQTAANHPVNPCPVLSGTCAFTSKIAGQLIAESTAKRGDAGTVAFLGTYKRNVASGALTSNSFVHWAAEKCNALTASYWSDVYSGAAAGTSDFGGTLTSFFSQLAWGDINPRMIIISEVCKGAFGIQAADQAIIDANPVLLQRFASTGGVLFSTGFQGGGGHATQGTGMALLRAPLRRLP